MSCYYCKYYNFIITIIFENEIVYGFGDYPGLGFRSIYLSPKFFPQLYTFIYIDVYPWWICPYFW
jgi:hypothetical protein